MIVPSETETRKFLSDHPPFRVEVPASDSFLAKRTLAFSDEGKDIAREEPEIVSEVAITPDDLFDQTIAHLRRDVERYPSSALPHLNLGLVLLNVNELTAAAAEFEASLRLDPEQRLAKMNLAQVRMLQGRLGEAEEGYSELRRAKVDDPGPLMGLADLAARRGDLGRAIELWGEVVDLAPFNTVAQFYLGMVLLQDGRRQEAIAHLRVATRLEVRSAVFHQGLGLAYAIAGQNRRAIRAFQAALTLAPGLGEAVRGLAEVYLKLGDGNKAVELLTQRLKMHPRDYEAGELLAWAHIELGEYRPARTLLFEAFKSVQESGHGTSALLSRLNNNLGVCYWWLGSLGEAAQQFSSSVGRSPDMVIPYHNLARVRLAENQALEAEGILRTCLTRFPFDDETWRLLAFVLDAQGRYPQAIDELRSWVNGGQASAKSYAVLGSLLIDAKRDPDAALAVLSDAERRFPGHPTVVNNLAYAHLMHGDVAAARVTLEALVQEPIDDDTNVVLKATWGLLHLHEGNLALGKQGYEDAERVAKRDGKLHLASTVRQKMHLECARAYQRQANFRAAQQEVRLGRTFQGLSHYQRDLEALDKELTTAG